MYIFKFKILINKHNQRCEYINCKLKEQYIHYRWCAISSYRLITENDMLYRIFGLPARQHWAV